jgi:hypothetical protein
MAAKLVLMRIKHLALGITNAQHVQTIPRVGEHLIFDPKVQQETSLPEVVKVTAIYHILSHSEDTPSVLCCVATGDYP